MKKIFGMLPFGLVQTAKRLILCIVVLHVFTIQASAVEIRVITIAGSGEYSSTDGLALAAELADPIGIAVDNAGAGTPGKPGFADGPGKAAQFNGPRAIDFDGEGNLIVADLGNNRIRKIILP